MREISATYNYGEVLTRIEIFLLNKYFELSNMDNLNIFNQNYRDIP